MRCTWERLELRPCRWRRSSGGPGVLCLLSNEVPPPVWRANRRERERGRRAGVRWGLRGLLVNGLDSPSRPSVTRYYERSKVKKKRRRCSRKRSAWLLSGRCLVDKLRHFCLSGGGEQRTGMRTGTKQMICIRRNLQGVWLMCGSGSSSGAAGFFAVCGVHVRFRCRRDADGCRI
ncbi:hypothetical protein LZ30DRAFT_258264 [Colletotrichum cereale]|nr:hypothetical protein LZ30DRAFT_258264 [Colletotrichum cereale]